MPDEGHALGALIQSVLAEQQRIAVVTAGLQKDTADCQVDLSKLSALLRDGNGGRPITTKIALLEDKIDRQGEDLRALRELWERREAEGRRGRWDLTKAALGALLAAALGALGTLLAGGK